MRISVTGNNLKNFFDKYWCSGGYTLLEIMAVLTLIGLISLIVYPQFTISPEKNEINYIEKLIKSDINLVKEEAFSSKEDLTIDFNTKGYSFVISETNISRNFMKYQFAFDVPAPKESDKDKDKDKEATGENTVEPTPTPENGGSEADNNETDIKDNEPKPNQIIFTSDGKCNQYELNWQTSHFTGKLKIDEDGVVDFSYAKK